MFSVKFNVKNERNGLSRAPELFRKNLRQALQTIGKRLVTSAVTRMRKDSGEERKSLIIRVKARGELGVDVFSEKLQAAIDAHGLRRGIFPPWKQGSRLNRWALRKVQGKQSERVKIVAKPPRRNQVDAAIDRNRRRANKGRTFRRVVEVGSTIELSAKQKRQRKGAKQLAFAIAKSIYKKGIKGTNWNTRTLQANQQMIKRELANGITRALNEMKRG